MIVVNSQFHQPPEKMLVWQNCNDKADIRSVTAPQGQNGRRFLLAHFHCRPKWRFVGHCGENAHHAHFRYRCGTHLLRLVEAVSRKLSFLAAFFRLSFVVVMVVTTLNYLGPAEILKGWHSPTAFNTGYNIALVFFGLHCLLIGYLTFKSAFLPRVLGVLLAIAGLSYLVNSFASFVAPALADVCVYYFIASWLLAEGSLTLWLLIIGVNVQQWQEQASHQGSSDGAIRESLL
jgi:hypothetical protein